MFTLLCLKSLLLRQAKLNTDYYFYSLDNSSLLRQVVKYHHKSNVTFCSLVKCQALLKANLFGVHLQTVNNTHQEGKTRFAFVLEMSQRVIFTWRN